MRDLPDVTAVTREGDLLGAHFASGGSTTAPSLLEVQAAVDEAADQLAAATHACERLGFDLSRLEEERSQAQRRVDVALAKLHESDATLAAVAEELGQLGSLARSAKGEAERLATAIAAAEEARDNDLAGLADLETRLAAAEDAPEEEPDTTERDRLAEAGTQRPGQTRWTPDSRCAPPRSAPARWPAAPTPCSAPPRPSARRAPGPPPGASGWSARARSPRRWGVRWPSCSVAWRSPSRPPQTSAVPSSGPAAAARRS